MSDVTQGTESPIPAPTLPADTGAITAEDAARRISEWRAKQAPAEAEQPKKDRGPDGKFQPKQESPQPKLEGDDAAPDDNPPSGEDAGAEPAEQPPIDPPKSWTKAEKERFSALPRETQEYIATREQERETEIRRTQNETAERSKALEAKEQAAEQARQQHEQAAQNALQVLQNQQNAEFSDIKTWTDVQRLANDDPFRFAKWQAQNAQIQAQMAEVQELNRKRSEDQQTQFKTWSKEQDTTFEKQFPEFTDKAKVGKLREGITSYLTEEVGVPKDVLPKLWENSLFRDAMFQRVIYDASRFHAARENAKQAVREPKPPVQRPGVGAQKGGNLQQEISEAADRLKNARGMNAIGAAADLMAAKRKASARR